MKKRLLVLVSVLSLAIFAFAANARAWNPIEYGGYWRYEYSYYTDEELVSSCVGGTQEVTTYDVTVNVDQWIEKWVDADTGYKWENESGDYRYRESRTLTGRYYQSCTP